MGRSGTSKYRNGTQTAARWMKKQMRKKIWTFAQKLQLTKEACQAIGSVLEVVR
jgi:hypothetical protein